MKGLLVICTLVMACDPPPTNLSGSIACGESSCDSGNLCVTTPSPIAPPPGYDATECWAVPASCDVFDCDSLQGGDTCVPCVTTTWYPCAAIVLEGRELFCSTI